jgi:hypothetical protein
MFLPHVLLLFCGAAPTPSPSMPGAGDFRIRAKVVEALEGGPFALEVELSYEGAVTLRKCQVAPLAVDVPSGWKQRPGPHYKAPIQGGDWSIDKTFQTRTIRFLHWHYAIPAGQARLKVGCEIWQAREGVAAEERWERKYRLIASPTTEIPLDIPPATPKNVAAFCERFEQQIEDRRYCRGQPLGCLEYTRHPALAALTWRIMERYPTGGFAWPLFELAAEYSESADLAEAHFLKLADDPGFESRTTLFRYWGDRQKPLSPAAFATLTRSERLWTRVLTCVHFGTLCEQTWIDALLRDLNDLPKPLPPDCLTRLLRELDSEGFATREKAMAQLADYGERAEAQLKQALQGPLSPEVKRRVRQLLEGIESAKDSPEWEPIVKCLRTAGRGGQARAVLTVLSKGPPVAALTKAAKAALQERDELFPDER